MCVLCQFDVIRAHQTAPGTQPVRFSPSLLPSPPPPSPSHVLLAREFRAFLGGGTKRFAWHARDESDQLPGACMNPVPTHPASNSCCTSAESSTPRSEIVSLPSFLALPSALAKSATEYVREFARLRRAIHESLEANARAEKLDWFRDGCSVALWLDGQNARA